MSDVSTGGVAPKGNGSSLPPNVDDLRKKANLAFNLHWAKQTAKKYSLAAVGTAAVVMGTNGAAVSNVPPARASVDAASFADDGPFDATKTHQRWPIKTAVTTNPDLLTPKVLNVADLAHFPAEPGTPQEFDSTFIPSQPQPGLQEGQIVQVEGYIHLVAFEKTDDSDYHVQINDKATNAVSDLNPCLIVEVPHPEAAATPDLADQFAAARKLLRDNCFSGGVPTGTVTTPLHVRVTGQLFYDLSHSGSSDPGGGRGKKVNGTVMHATTIWEIHPVTKIELLDSQPD